MRNDPADRLREKLLTDCRYGANPHCAFDGALEGLHFLKRRVNVAQNCARAFRQT
jgi:hypothetical protein